MLSSDCPSMSMNPGATTFPATSIRRVAAAPARLPIAAIRPSRRPRSAAYHASPRPTTPGPAGGGAGGRRRPGGAGAVDDVAVLEDQVEGGVRGAQRRGQQDGGEEKQ